MGSDKRAGMYPLVYPAGPVEKYTHSTVRYHGRIAMTASVPVSWYIYLAAAICSGTSVPVVPHSSGRTLMQFGGELLQLPGCFDEAQRERHAYKCEELTTCKSKVVGIRWLVWVDTRATLFLIQRRMTFRTSARWTGAQCAGAGGVQGGKGHAKMMA